MTPDEASRSMQTARTYKVQGKGNEMSNFNTIVILRFSFLAPKDKEQFVKAINSRLAGEYVAVQEMAETSEPHQVPDIEVYSTADNMKIIDRIANIYGSEGWNYSTGAKVLVNAAGEVTIEIPPKLTNTFSYGWPTEHFAGERIRVQFNDEGDIIYFNYTGEDRIKDNILRAMLDHFAGSVRPTTA